jgi:carboxypeptidase family protein
MLRQVIIMLSLVSLLSLISGEICGQTQSTSGDISGTVLSPQQSSLPGATVTVLNLSTGLARTVTTDATGKYRIPLLPPGRYEVKVEVKGFNTQVKRGITLTIGQAAVVDFEMVLGAIKEAEVVDTDTPVVEPERTHQSSTITQKLILNFPINGRKFLDFAKLTPGVVEEPPTVTAVQTPALTASSLSFSGLNARGNSVQIDGVDNNDIATNGVRPTISQEAVSEFQINRNGYNAEFGRAIGGVINLVTKSGDNQFHGNVYDYFRNEILDARNTFASGQSMTPPFKRNQPGFTFGGPIKKDKTFFFAAYEGLIRRESSITTILTDPAILQPTVEQQDLINTLVGSRSPALVLLGQQLRGLLTTSPDSPFPLANSTLPFNPVNRNTYNLLAGSNGVFPIIETSSTGSFRLDHAFSERDFLFFRYNLNNISQHNIGVGGQMAPSAGFDIASRDHTFVLGQTHIFNGGGTTNEFRLQLFRNVLNANTVDPFGPRLRIAGIGNFGREILSPSDRTQKNVQFVDNFSLTRGNHNIKVGGDFSRYNFNTMTAAFLGGTIDFARLYQVNLQTILGNRPEYQALVSALNGPLARPDLVNVLQNLPLTTVQQVNFGFARAINQGFGDPNVEMIGQNLGLFLQDGVKATPNLYLSFGLRYDYQLQPAGIPRDSNNLAPRFSFAYDPFKNGRTVIRGGGGLYYQYISTSAVFASRALGGQQISSILVSADQTLPPSSANTLCGQQAAAGIPPSFCFYQNLVSSGFLNFPMSVGIPESAYSNLLGLTRDTSTNRLLFRLAGDAANPYSIQGNFGIDHQFGRDWNLSINYLVNHGVNLIRTRQVNALANPNRLDALGRPSLTGRQDQTRLADFVLETAGNSIYHGLNVEVNKRFNRYYQLIGAYSFGKTISDTSDYVFEQGPQDPTNASLDRGLSSFDVRHRLSVGAVFDSPFRGGRGSPWYQRALADFYFSPITTVRSGFPFDVQTGIDVNMDNNVNDRPYALGRNTGIGPGFFAVDMRIGRRIRLTRDGSRSLELIFDSFNLFNRVNFKEVNANTYGILFLDQLGNSGNGMRGSANLPPSSFSGFTSAYDPRIIQLAVKINF